MSESRWETDGTLVLRSLEDLRISSDASLKGVNDLRIGFVELKGAIDNQGHEMRGTIASQGREIESLKKRIDGMIAWGLGILAALIVGGIGLLAKTVMAVSQVVGK